MPQGPSSSRWVKCISAQGSIRGVAIQATDLVQKMAVMHGLKNGNARPLGEATIGALLIASYVKNQERVNLNVQGSGHIRQALVDAHPDGTVRGYVMERASTDRPIPRQKDLPPRDPAEPVGPWGEGLLSVLRTKTSDHEQPYIGTVPLLTGHLAKDLTFYWVQSEQIPSAVGLAVSLDGDRVSAAGGFLVQAMPGASHAEIKAIEQNIQEIQSLAVSLSEESDPVHLLSQIFQSSAFMLVEEKPLEFSCNCSWERVRRALTLVGVEELSSILAEDEEASVRCDFCTKEYRVDATTLKQMIQVIKGVS